MTAFGEAICPAGNNPQHLMADTKGVGRMMALWQVFNCLARGHLFLTGAISVVTGSTSLIRRFLPVASGFHIEPQGGFCREYVRLYLDECRVCLSCAAQDRELNPPSITGWSDVARLCNRRVPSFTGVYSRGSYDRFVCRYHSSRFLSGLSQVWDAGVGNSSLCWKRNRGLRLDVPAWYLWRILQRRLRHDSDSSAT